MEIENKHYNYKIKPRIIDRIDSLVKNGRFDDVDDFVDRAIDVFLAWEINPPGAMQKMMELDPVIEQYAHMVRMGMDYTQLQMMYPEYPEKFGSAWELKLTEDPTLFKKFEDSKNMHNPQTDKRAIPHDYENALSHKTINGNFLRLNDFSDSEDHTHAYQYDGWPLVFHHYSRMFPARVGVLALVDLMTQSDKKEVYFEEFTKVAYDLCEEIASAQIKRETSKKISRENRTSTGLPKPLEDEDKLTEKQKLKQLEYETRYKEKYFGKIKRNREDGKEYFEGLMSVLNLIQTYKKNDELYVTLTEKGKELFFKENPTFSGDLSEVFSEEEGIFILESLLPERELEMILMSSAINLIKSKEGLNEKIVSQLDEQFFNKIQEYCNLNKDNTHIERLESILEVTEEINKNKKEAKLKKEKITDDDDEKDKLDKVIKKQTPIEAIRIGTMGRMSELNLVEWEIIDGISHYKTKNKKLIDIVQKHAEK